MNIKSIGEVSVIRLKHKGTELNMECIIPAVYGDFPKPQPSNIALIEFTDTTEIETMIRMLERFKEDAIAAMGRWYPI